VAGDFSFDLDAAGLRADAADVATSVEVLAAKLEAALPGATRVERRARGLLRREKAVEAIEVGLGGTRYALRMRDGRPEATREQEVRGVVIRREPLDLAAWTQALGDDLAEQARSSAQARAALERLLS
jgi:hypothetical protein